TTFDGRYYSSIRGVGGRITLLGTEEIAQAAHCGFNAIAHEFAHQVQETAMGPEDLSALRALYRTAVKEGRTLDYYAAADVYEYFAVGYEAFVSPYKRPLAVVTAGHTRRELLDRDPQLYAYISSLGRRAP
ncbi:MAG TPA: hypothetical protein VJX67_00675, partial [Blastocatellia bacterium]|nr:hypothetical protein [Blastocatellia bacterium]